MPEVVTIPLAAAFGAADLRRIGLVVICFVVAVGLHEFAHAWAADRLGDPTPRRDGRLTLNPLVHADLVGTLVLPVVMSLMGGTGWFGWGRPVMTSPRNYTRKLSMRAGQAFVAFAGPLANLIQVALVVAAVFLATLAGAPLRTWPGAVEVLHTFVTLNMVLFAFNLIPLHPLDGGKVLAWVLGHRFAAIDAFLERQGWLVLVVLMFGLGPVLQAIVGPFAAAGQYLLALAL